MADVTGPVSTLPGQRKAAPAGMMCDDHPDRSAYRRVQGETDSFGAEFLDLCKECCDEIAAYEREEFEKEKYCEWCGKMKTHVRIHRDFEEGLAGRLYDVCMDCRRKEHDNGQ